MNISYGPESLIRSGLLPVLSTSDMRAADEATIAAGTSSAVLMEVAGRAVADVASRVLAEIGGKRVLVACGKGNNGGDGYVVARVLAARGFDVSVISMHEPGELSADAAAQFDRLTAHLNADIQGQLTLVAFNGAGSIDTYRPDLVVDAALGIGITAEVRAPISHLIKAINKLEVPVVSVDVPSGLDADTGVILGDCVTSSVTVTLGAVKKGLLMNDGPTVCGHLEVAEIGIIPDEIRERAQSRGTLLTTNAWVSKQLPERSPDAHKYSAGMALVVGGSHGMTGAPVMTALAAARGGAGYVCAAVPSDVLDVVAGKLTTPTMVGLPQVDSGGIDAPAAMNALEPWIERARALAIGPGLGRDRSTLEFVRLLLESCTVPAVIDADALFALADDPAFLERYGRPDWLLTPHRGEFMRLAPDAPPGEDPFNLVRNYSRRWNVTLLLKGSPSVVGSPSGHVIASSIISSAMATAGTGDVLSGLCASLIAQGLAPFEGAAAAMHIGGRASQQFSTRHHPSSMIATDIIDMIPTTLHEITV